jgi:hypothetical protein
MTQDLIRDNMEDLGLDSFQVVDDRIPPPLYPDIQIPVPNALSEEDKFAVQKMREISHRQDNINFLFSFDNFTINHLALRIMIDNCLEFVVLQLKNRSLIFISVGFKCPHTT